MNNQPMSPQTAHSKDLEHAKLCSLSFILNASQCNHVTYNLRRLMQLSRTAHRRDIVQKTNAEQSVTAQSRCRGAKLSLGAP
jgi:hypothetical protein